MLPLMYWQEQLSRTRCLAQKAQIAQALKTMQDAFERHPCTGRLGPEVLAGWKAWAADHAKAFQRAIRIDPQNVDAHYNLGQLYLRTGLKEEGQAEMELYQKLEQGEARKKASSR